RTFSLSPQMVVARQDCAGRAGFTWGWAGGSGAEASSSRPSGGRAARPDAAWAGAAADRRTAPARAAMARHNDVVLAKESNSNFLRGVYDCGLAPEAPGRKTPTVES